MQSQEQMDALASPVRLEIVDCLQRCRRASIADLAKRLGRSAGSLYRHVHHLVRAGVLSQAGKRRAGRRYEVVYTITPGAFQLDLDPDLPGSADYLKRYAGAILRLAERDFRAAVERGEVVTRGSTRNVVYQRRKVRLTKQGLARLVRHMDEAVQIILEEDQQGQGRYYAMTAFLTPLSESKYTPASS
jgi:DNA-binding transcriptional ArsR family regulator